MHRYCERPTELCLHLLLNTYLVQQLLGVRYSLPRWYPRRHCMGEVQDHHDLFFGLLVSTFSRRDVYHSSLNEFEGLVTSSWLDPRPHQHWPSQMYRSAFWYSLSPLW